MFFSGESIQKCGATEKELEQGRPALHVLRQHTASVCARDGDDGQKRARKQRVAS
jgi:hypothetical protein